MLLNFDCNAYTFYINFFFNYINMCLINIIILFLNMLSLSLKNSKLKTCKII